MSVSKRHVYIDTGVHATPAPVKLGRIKNISRPKSRASTEHDFRESDHTKTVAGNVKFGLEFEYTETPDYDETNDPALAALLAATDGEPVRFFVMRGDIATTGTKGLEGYYYVTDSPEEDEVNDRVKHSFTLAEADHYVDGDVFDVQAYTAP